MALFLAFVPLMYPADSIAMNFIGGFMDQWCEIDSLQNFRYLVVAVQMHSVLNQNFMFELSTWKLTEISNVYILYINGKFWAAVRPNKATYELSTNCRTVFRKSVPFLVPPFSHSQQQYIAIPCDKDTSNGYQECNKFPFNYSQIPIEDYFTWDRASRTKGITEDEYVDCNGQWIFDQSLYVSTIRNRVSFNCRKYGKL